MQRMIGVLMLAAAHHPDEWVAKTDCVEDGLWLGDNGWYYDVAITTRITATGDRPDPETASQEAM